MTVLRRNFDCEQFVLRHRHVLCLRVVHSSRVALVFVLSLSLFGVCRGAGSDGPVSSENIVELILLDRPF